MKTDTLKKSLLDYAIKGKLTARFRRENSGLNAFDELEIYNDEIKAKRKDLEKKLKTLESTLKKAPTRHRETSAESRGKTKHDPHAVIASERSDPSFPQTTQNPQTKQNLKSQIQALKKEIANCKEITPLFNQSHEVQPLKASSGVWGVKGGIRGATSRADEVKPVIRKFKPPCPPLKEKANNIESTHNEAGESEAPFEIPSTWAWVKLGDICEIVSGEITDLQEENLPLLDVKYLRGKGDKKLANSGSFVNANDRLILMDGENSGEIFITKEKGFLGSTLKKLEFSSLSRVEFMDFMLLCYKDFFKGNKKGAAIPHLDRKLFANLSIPLPPLKEQQEIVKKLDLLVALANDFAITKENLKRIEKRIEKSLLKLALEGSLSKLYRRSSPTLSAFNEINTYNDKIREKRKDLEKKLKTLESKLKKVGKRDFSPTAQNDKQRITQNAVSLENDKNAHCHTASTCHTDLEQSEREVSQNTESKLVIFASVGKSFARASECEKSTKELKQNLKSQIQSLKKEIAKCKEITPLFNQSHEVQPLKASSGVWGVKGGIRGATSRADEVKPVIRKFKPPCPPLKEKANNIESTHNEAGESEAPFEIPSTWAWVKGCDIFLPIDNTEPQGDFFKYIDIDSIDNKNKKVKSPKTIETKNASSRARRPLEYGDVLFSMVRPYLENIALIDEKLADCIASTGFFVCRTNILDSRFLYYLMTSPYVVYGLNSFMKGDNSPSIVKDDILNFNYPLPPLQEQKHITQTLDTLFTLKKGLRVE